MLITFFTSSLTMITAIMLFILGIISFSKNKKSEINFSFSLICFSAFVWLFSYAIAYQCVSSEKALIFYKIGYEGVIFISITYFNFSTKFLGLRKLRWLTTCSFIVGIFLAIILFKTNLIVDETHSFFWGRYPKAGPLHPLFLIIFMGHINAALGQLAFHYFYRKDKTSPVRKQQLKYILLALGIFTVACVDFLPNYGVEVYPFGFVPATIFLIIIFFSILKYRLLDISLAITRTTVFVVVYSIILGIPLGIAFWGKEKLIELFQSNWWMVPLFSSTFLATIGPFIYLYIQKRAEDSLLQEQRRYQSTLRQASSGMAKVKDLRRLLSLIVHIVTRVVHLEHSMVYLFDGMNKKFFLGSSRWRNNLNSGLHVIEINSSLVEYLNKTRSPVVYEEIKQQTQDYAESQLVLLEKELARLDAAVVVPSFIEKKLLALIILGRKKNGKLYSESDLSVFSILANQAALAIENALFYEDMKKTHEQLFKAEKMATIGTMADGLSHQINNRLHAMGFIAGDAMDTIKLKKQSALSDDMKDLLNDLEFAFSRVQENVKQGGEVVQGLLKYTRKGDQGFSDVDFDKLLKAAFEMVQFKIKLSQLSVVKEIPVNLPAIKGNFTQLQEVFFNLIDNAYDAMMQRKLENNEPGYKARLLITAKIQGTLVRLEVIDNGIGVKKEDVDKLFTPFFTTKLSSKKGTGLGLYVIRKIIEDNHGGQVQFTSDYMQGTRFVILLPVYV